MGITSDSSLQPNGNNHVRPGHSGLHSFQWRDREQLPRSDWEKLHEEFIKAYLAEKKTRSEWVLAPVTSGLTGTWSIYNKACVIHYEFGIDHQVHTLSIQLTRLHNFFSILHPIATAHGASQGTSVAATAICGVGRQEIHGTFPSKTLPMMSSKRWIVAVCSS